tara:strand:+ start:72 stop:245 length:174 start_codon:yes stop_codon:yes gene_type:complete
MSLSFDNSNLLDDTYQGNIKIAGLKRKSYDDLDSSVSDEDEIDVSGNRIHNVIPQNV